MGVNCDVPNCAIACWFGMTNPPEILEEDGVGRLSLFGQGAPLGWLMRDGSGKKPGGIDVGGNECKR